MATRNRTELRSDRALWTSSLRARLRRRDLPAPRLYQAAIEQAQFGRRRRLLAATVAGTAIFTGTVASAGAAPSQPSTTTPTVTVLAKTMTSTPSAATIAAGIGVTPAPPDFNEFDGGPDAPHDIVYAVPPAGVTNPAPAAIQTMTAPVSTIASTKSTTTTKPKKKSTKKLARTDVSVSVAPVNAASAAPSLAATTATGNGPAPTTTRVIDTTVAGTSTPGTSTPSASTPPTTKAPILFAEPTAAPSAPNPRAPEAIAFALAQLGVPYLWGGVGPEMGGYDCSGLTMSAWATAGVKLAHQSGQQFLVTERVARADIAPGDLVFFGAPIHHVGIYIGDGKMVEAPTTGKLVRVSSIKRSDLVGIGRIP